MGTRPGAIPVLMLNQLGFNLGFYMLLPYLSGFLQVGLGYSTWMIGLVLGIRNFSQQGFFLVGGTVADRMGYKPVITIGCFLRAIGFLSFAYFESLPGVLLASFLSGFSAALFTPAMQAYLAHEGTENRVKLFAIFNVLAEVGLFSGPLIGILLLNWNFQWVCVVSALIFCFLGILQIYFLPSLDGVESKSKVSFWADWKTMVQNRNFLWFSIVAMGYYILVMQIYMTIPLEIQRSQGSQQDVASIFLLSALISILLQMKLQQWSQRWLSTGHSIALGVFLMGFAFLPLLFKAHHPTFFVFLSVGLLTIGTLMALPFMMALIPIYSQERRLGSYYGFFYLLAGMGSALGNAVSGYVFDYAYSIQRPEMIWLFFFAIGLISSGAFVVLTLKKKIPLAAA